MMMIVTEVATTVLVVLMPTASVPLRSDASLKLIRSARRRSACSTIATSSSAAELITTPAAATSLPPATSGQAAPAPTTGPVSNPDPTGAPSATTPPPITPPPTAPATTPPPAPADGWTVVSITDGDTLVVSGPGGELTVRVIGINAPESSECLADEAAAALRTLTSGAVVLQRDTSDVDQYGRALRYVENGDGLDVGAELVRLGLAISRRYEPDTARNDRYDALQRAARAAGAGQWAADACGPATTGVRVTVDIHADAAGDDNVNLNDEWVRFTNAGGDALSLDGWTVADESASHRYTFAALELPPGGSVTLYTGCGVDTATERYWCNARSAVWNNRGDTVFLRDPTGNTVLAETY